MKLPVQTVRKLGKNKLYRRRYNIFQIISYRPVDVIRFDNMSHYKSYETCKAC